MRKSYGLYFKTELQAMLFRVLYYDYFIHYNTIVGGVYRSRLENYPWLVIFECQTSEWEDMKKKLKLKRRETIFYKSTKKWKKDWVFII